MTRPLSGEDCIARGMDSCLDCGACCAKYRVSFHWSETLAESNRVPIEMTTIVNAHQLAMSGTDQALVRCVALKGEVGCSVNCEIYSHRPSACRDFNPYDSDGNPNARCVSARAHYGLEPLSSGKRF